MSFQTIRNAVLGHHHDVLAWVWAKGTPTVLAARSTEDSGVVCVDAVEAGWLDTLHWLRETGDVPWDARTFEAAVKTKNWDVLEYLRHHSAPYDADWGYCHLALELNFFEIVPWFHRHGYPCTADAWARS